MKFAAMRVVTATELESYTASGWQFVEQVVDDIVQAHPIEGGWYVLRTSRFLVGLPATEEKEAVQAAPAIDKEPKKIQAKNNQVADDKPAS